MLRLALLAPLSLLLAGCGGGDRQVDPRGVDHDETLLSVSATGEAETVPDLATIEIGVQTYGGNAKAANDANSRKAAEIAKALAACGVADKDIQTRNLSLNRVDYGPRKGQFQADNLLAVRLHDVPKAGVMRGFLLSRIGQDRFQCALIRMDVRQNCVSHLGGSLRRWARRLASSSFPAVLVG